MVASTWQQNGGWLPANDWSSWALSWYYIFLFLSNFLLALKYELQLAEIKKEHGKGANVERIDLTFFILGTKKTPQNPYPLPPLLDELIPQFGVYQRVMKMLRQELYSKFYQLICILSLSQLQFTMMNTQLVLVKAEDQQSSRSVSLTLCQQRKSCPRGEHGIKITLFHMCCTEISKYQSIRIR